MVAEAETGEASIDMAAQLHPDLVLMDFNLPGIDGMEATRRIRASGANPPVVVMLSKYELDEYGPRAVEAGAAAFIPKSDFTPTASSRRGTRRSVWRPRPRPRPYR